jgi:sterol desaturase/sphingolipid hydroxylase (fatty acid hydroxylase superfamily)
MPQNNANKMFENPFFEFFAKSNPVLIVIIHLGIIFSIFSFGIWRLKINLHPIIFCIVFSSGIFTWTFAEYLIHRYVFHWVGKNKLIKSVHYALHGHHHQNPTDDQHLFMPPLPLVFIIFFLFSFFYLFLGNYTFVFFPGFELGYLVYSLIHYAIHLKPYSTGILGRLWLHHGKHHFVNSRKAYGVSNIFWDQVFGTTPDKN